MEQTRLPLKKDHSWEITQTESKIEQPFLVLKLLNRQAFVYGQTDTWMIIIFPDIVVGREGVYIRKDR